MGSIQGHSVRHFDPQEEEWEPEDFVLPIFFVPLLLRILVGETSPTLNPTIVPGILPWTTLSPHQLSVQPLPH